MTNPNKKSKLLRLVKSLKVNEKRYVVIYLSKHKKDNNLLRLYKTISENSEITDADILKKNNEKKFTSQFAKNKHLLYGLILDALHQFHLKKSPYARVLTMLHQAEILANKGLFDDQKEWLLKAGQIADDFELTELKLEILKLRNTVDAEKNSLKKILEETECLSNKIIQRSKLVHLIRRILVLTRITGNRLTARQISYLRAHSLNELKKQRFILDSFFMNYFYLDYFLMYYTITGNYYESYITGTKILKLVKQNPSMLQLQIWRDKYGSSLSRLINASAMISKNEMVDFAHKEVSRLDIPYNRKSLIELNMLDIYIQSGEFKKGEISLNRIQKNASYIQKGLDPYTSSILYFNLAVMNFGLGNYSKAIFWFNEIINDSNKYIPDQYFGGITMILRMITYYELKRYDIIELHLRSTHRYIMKTKRNFKFDQIMVAFIGKIIAINNKHELITIMKQVRNELLTLSKIKTEGKILHYFDFIAWLESKIENRPFAQIIKEKGVYKNSNVYSF
ncbi:MAG: hypothetical protein HYU69_17290 [Bacteroidetes bacterium]|nr:hypothetical protein [Bacteroidota bacterium]